MNKSTILIIDDDRETRVMYAEIFRRDGWRVYTAADGLEGFDVARKVGPDVILTGIVMPRLDGFALLEALKGDERTAGIPVAINSHWGRAGDEARARALGARDFLVRNLVSPAEVVSRISSLLDQKNSFVLSVDPETDEAEKLARHLGANGSFVLPDGRRLKLRLRLRDKNKVEGEFFTEG